MQGWFVFGYLQSIWWCKFTDNGTFYKEYGNNINKFRLASLAITCVIDNLIFDPILSRILGHTKFYRAKGYFYEFPLSQEYK